jgi:hypothetical protein
MAGRRGIVSAWAPHASAQARKLARKNAAQNKKKRDFAQIALSTAEQITGGPLTHTKK